MNKKILMILILMILINKVYSASSYSTTCSKSAWWVAAYWGCSVNSNCQENSYYSGGCSSGCSYCGKYLDPCSSTTDMTGTCTCDSGYAHCDSDTSNGCEIDLREDENNCGSCGKKCASNEFCYGGVCTVKEDYSHFYTDGCHIVSWDIVPNCGNDDDHGYVSAYNSGNPCDYDSNNMGYCSCDSGYGNCDLDWGCEYNLNTNENNCGSCGVDCGDKPCVSGTCTSEDSDMWARVEAECVSGDDTQHGFSNTLASNGNCKDKTYCKDIQDSPNPLTDYDGNCGLDTDNTIDYIGYVKCDENHRDCNDDGLPGTPSFGSDWDGCETEVYFDENNCGGCGIKCGTGQYCFYGECKEINDFNEFQGGCTSTKIIGDLYEATCGINSIMDDRSFCLNSESYSACTCQGTYRNCDENTIDCETDTNTNINYCGDCDTVCSEEVTCSATDKTKCEYYCNSGSCSAATLSSGICSQDSQCVSGLSCMSNNIAADTNSYCCESDQCSYNSACYDALSSIEIGDTFYYCKNDNGAMKWYSVLTKLNLSNMISYNHFSSVGDTLYFNDFGVTDSCNEENYQSCTYDSGLIPNQQYSYKYCLSYNIVFDGMFSIETQDSVPISVSEQELYNPYFKPSAVVATTTGCTTYNGNEGGLYCVE